MLHTLLQRVVQMLLLGLVGLLMTLLQRLVHRALLHRPLLGLH